MAFMSEINVGSFVALVFIFLLFNVVFIYSKSRKARQAMKKIKDERVAAQKYEETLKDNLSKEQKDAKRKLDLQNKTFELYEQVRKQAAQEQVSDVSCDE